MRTAWSSSCSQSPHDEKGRNDNHAGLVLPERAPSEGPRSTGAMRPAWAPFLKADIASSEGSIISMVDVRRAQLRIDQATLIEEK
jgi:hypothetical protein